MLRLGIRGHDVPVTGTFEDWVGAIADQGFCCTQLALKKAVKQFYVGTDAMTSGMAMYMRNVFAEKKVNVSVLGCYLNVTTPDEEEWKAVKNTYEAHLRFAKFLGCGMVGTETGAMNKEYAPGPENRTEAALEKLISRVKELTDIAEKFGVCLGIEPVVRHNMYNIERTKKVVDAVASPNLRVILDAVNLLDVTNSDKQSEIFEEAFDLLNDHIDVLHIKDFVKAGETLRTTDLVVGEGELDLARILKYAKTKKPCIEILIEDSNPGNIMASKANIEKLYASL
ncbi:MAG: sugar phosphate isomerase/epimerase [Lachnospiraceae bacterium]|nr:sugar phosphate isomerase/epimerase [Lachnospiraceae bacterium]